MIQPSGPSRVIQPSGPTRVSGRDKVTGLARYAADRRLPGMLFAAHVRSPLAHARVSRVDARRARAVPGVTAVLTGPDVRPAAIGRNLQDWPVLAWDRVRFIGDRVAVVAAETPEAATLGAEAVEVEYDELPAVFDPDAALAPDAPILHPDAAEYRMLGGPRAPRHHENIQGEHRITTGEAEVAAALARATRVFEHEFRTPRQHQGYIEPHACLAWPEGDRLHVVSTNKGPYMLRRQLATSLDLDLELVVVESPVIGGDFGGKGLSLDEYACAILARTTGRPVMAVMDYASELQASAPRHAARLHLTTGVDADGRILAHRLEAVVDGGAYAAGKPGRVLAPLGTLETLGPYHVPQASLAVTAVYTNNLPGGNMRAPGEYQAIFAGESHLDRIAAELGLDPLELRRRNALADGSRTVTGGVARRPRVGAVIDALDEIAERRPKRSGSGHGIGFAVSTRGPASGHSTVRLTLIGDGRIEALTGIPDQGGGTNAVVAAVVARVLGVAADRIVAASASTAVDLPDTGVSGSRVAVHAGRAAEAAAIRLRESIESAVAERMGVDRSSVRLREDGLEVTAAAGGVARRPFGDAVRDLDLPPVTVTFDGRDAPEDTSHDSVAGYAVEVDVDRETGRVTIARATLVADTGAILNPIGYEGQLRGGFAGGVGGALFEALPVEDGRVGATNLHEYKLPSTLDVPDLEIVALPPVDGPGPFGAKMAGEMTNGAVAPAIANAIADAVGVRLASLPLSAEAIHAALRAAEEAPPGA